MLKMVLKLLFKATLPLLVVIGITSYVLHVRGGDPLALLNRIGGGAGDRLSAVLESIKEGAGATLAATRSTLTSTASGASVTNTLYRWEDADGSPHYSNVEPTGIEGVVIVNVDPNQNLLQAPVKPAPVVEPASTQPKPLPGATGIALPGVDAAVILGRAQRR